MWHRGGDLLVDREDVGQLALVALGPDVAAVRHVDELNGDADAVAGFADAALQHLAHVEQASDLSDVPRRVLELKAGRPGDDSKLRDLRQAVDELLRQSVAEVLVVPGPALMLTIGRTARRKSSAAAGAARFARAVRGDVRLEGRRVAADRNIDANEIGGALRAVVRAKLRPQASHLHPARSDRWPDRRNRPCDQTPRGRSVPLSAATPRPLSVSSTMNRSRLESRSALASPELVVKRARCSRTAVGDGCRRSDVGGSGTPAAAACRSANARSRAD